MVKGKVKPRKYNKTITRKRKWMVKGKRSYGLTGKRKSKIHNR
jgi:hypothetical protein